MEVGEEVEEGEVPTGMGRTVTFSGGGRSSDGGGFERGGGGGQSSEGGGFERGGGGRKERRKGRGFDATKDTPADRYEGRGGIFDRLGDPRATETDAGPAKCKNPVKVFMHRFPLCCRRLTSFSSSSLSLSLSLSSPQP